MARAGKFGRAPRVAPSLTNTVIAIAREFQQQRDQNLMDAWQKGGEFEGQKATDALVLKHWQDKIGGVSKDDPLYDTYKNTVTQLDYTIHESKMTAQYAQHKTTDAAMVSFYLGWAKKVPKDSEFYRVLQRDAGQYMRQSQSNTKAKEAAAKELAYQKAQSTTRQSQEAAGEYVIDTLRRVAQSGYAKGGVAINPLIAAPGSGSDLTDFDPSDPATMQKLLAIIDPMGQKAVPGGIGPAVPTGKSAGTANVIYHDDDKNPVTGADIIKKLQSLDPTFKPGAPLDTSYIVGLLDKQNKGLQERIDRATKTGHMSDAASLQKSKEYVATLNREVGAWPIAKAYSDLRDTRDAVVNDPTASPQAVLKAQSAYQSALAGLANDKRIAADDNTRNRLMAEAQGQTGAPSLHESFTGLQNGAFDPASAKDVADQKAHMEFLQKQVDAVANQQALWTYGTTGSDGVFKPNPSGKEIGAAPWQDITASGAPGSETSIVVSDPRGGNPITMAVTAVPVKAVATMPDGTAIHPENDNPVAYAYDIPSGGQTITIYGFKSKEGSLVFSAEPPWDPNLPVNGSSSGGNHLEVNMSSLIPTTAGANVNTPGLGVDLMHDTDPGTPGIQTADGKTLAGFHVQGAGDPTVNNPNGTPGTLTFDPYAALTSTSTRNVLGDIDPTTDFRSLTLATLMATPGGQDVLRDIDHNPAFKSQLDADANYYAGVQRDPATGGWVPGTGDQNKLAVAMGQNQLAVNSKSIVDFLNNSLSSWQRQTTGSPFQGGTTDQHPGKTQDDALGGKLATDLVQNTAFAALGAAFLPGSSVLKPPPDPNAPSVTNINPIKALQVPTYTPTPAKYNPAPITVQGPVAGQTGSVAPTPSQTGSQAPATQTGSMPTKPADNLGSTRRGY